MRLLVLALLLTAVCCASESSFSVNDDVFAFPQYAFEFSDSYITEEEAQTKLRSSTLKNGENGASSFRSKDVSTFNVQDGSYSGHSHGPVDSFEYEVMMLHGARYLCSIPIVQKSMTNKTEPVPSEADQEKELVRAIDRGRQLLREMEGNQCLFYTTGWWTYSFCYNSQVKQFHALAPGANGKMWPPQEDPTTPSYVLGRFEAQSRKESPQESGKDELAELQTKAETTYLVQRLEGGTPCDLTGKARKIEVQFHCNPQLTDRIGWIKETATCAYLMIIYTPRLCNDVAFQPPKEGQAQTISCQQMLRPAEIGPWEASKEKDSGRKSIGDSSEQRIMIGNIEVGAMRYVGKDGKRIERGRIVLTQEEKAETLIMQKDGQVSSVSQADLKKLDLDPEDIEAFQKELQKIAGAKDWKIERLDDVDGQIQLRGVISTDEGDDEKKTKDDSKEEPAGSEEEYKEDV